MSQPDRDEPRREWPVDLAEVVEAVSALPLEVRAELALGSLPDDQGCRACKALHATAPVHDTPANRLQHWHEALVRHHAGHGREQDATRAGMIYGVALAQVVESREPFPSDEDVEAGAKALMEKWPETRMVLGEINAPLVARAVLDAVSSHHQTKGKTMRVQLDMHLDTARVLLEQAEEGQRAGVGGELSAEAPRELADAIKVAEDAERKALGE